MTPALVNGFALSPDLLRFRRSAARLLLLGDGSSQNSLSYLLKRARMDAFLVVGCLEGGTVGRPGGFRCFAVMLPSRACGKGVDGTGLLAIGCCSADLARFGTFQASFPGRLDDPSTG